MLKVVAAVLAAIALASCAEAFDGRAPMADAASDAAGRQFAPPSPGKAALYVFRADKPQPIVWTVLAGRTTIAQLGTMSWSRVELSPGRHDLRCVGGREATPSLVLDLSAGQTRYVALGTEWLRIACTLNEVDAAAGRAGVSAGKRVLELN